MKKQLVINADDFGMSRGTTDGILQCVRAGVVTSTTIMVTGAAFDYAIQKLPELGGVSVGVHLDATSGTPVSPVAEITSLVDPSGRFIPRRDASAVASMRTPELELEFRRQIQRASEAGVKISHLDNHHNWVYFSPTHFEVTARLAKELSVPLRFPFGSFSEERVEVISKLTVMPESEVRKAVDSCLEIMERYQVKHTDYFWIEFTSIHRSEKYLRDMLNSLPDGTSEVCVHPGQDSERQKQELEILLKSASDGWIHGIAGLELVNYGAIGG